MDAKFNLRFLILFLCTSILFIYNGIFSPLTGLFLITFVLIFYKRESIENFQEVSGGTAGSNELWDVHFQNKVLFFNSPCALNSNFGNKTVGSNCSISDLNNLPTWYSWENFVIEDARLAYGSFRGNVNRVPYGSPIYVQSQSRSDATPTYVTVASSKLSVSESRDSNAQFMLEPVDTSLKRSFVKFGDGVYIRHIPSNMYIAKPSNTNNNIKLSNIKDKTSQWNIYNQMGYGHSRQIDWAREALATMSSIYANKKYLPSNCTDGDRNTFCHSDSDKDTQEPYIDIHLTRLLDIKKVAILNRQDCCKDRLGSFWVKVYFDNINAENGKLETKEIYKSQHTASSTQDGFTLENISAVGNRVRVQLSNTGAKRILNLATVSVFGDPVFNTVGANTQLAESSNFILYKPLQVSEKMAVPININCVNTNCNFGVHFMINLSESFSGGTIFSIDKLRVKINNNGKIVVNYVLQNNESSVLTLTGKTELQKMRFNYVSLFLYAGINQENGWAKIKNKATNAYLLVNESEKKYFTTWTSNSNTGEFTSADAVPLEQYEYLGHVKSGYENVPFMRLFVNRKLDSNISFTQSSKVVVGQPRLELYPLKGFIGPLKITNFYYTNEQINRIISFEDNINLGRFDVSDNKRISGMSLPTFGKMGYSLAFWLYIDSENMQNGTYCVFNKKKNLVVMYNSGKYVLEFIFTNSKSESLVYTVPFSHSIVPFQFNHFVVTVDNVKKECKIFQNLKAVQTKKATHAISMDNVEPILVGNCNNSSGLPLKGKITHFNIANYVYSKKQMEKFYTENKEVGKEIDKVNKLFHSVGCPAKILDEKSATPELQQMYLATLSRDPGSLQKSFERMKHFADDFIDNPDSNPERLRMLDMCYGATTTKVLNRILHLSEDIANVKSKGEVNLLLVDGAIDTKSSTVIGPKKIKTYKLDNVKIEFNLSISSLPASTAANVIAFKFIQGKKHALVPQIFFEGNHLAMDIYTSEGIESVVLADNTFNYDQWYRVTLVFHKGYELNVFVNNELALTKETMGQILISNVFEAIVGAYTDLPGFEGKVSDLKISYNTLYSNFDSTKIFLNDTYSLSAPKKITESMNTKNNENSASFTIHFWMYLRSQPNTAVCSILQGVYRKTFFKVQVTQDANQSMLLTVGQSTTVSVPLPGYFFNQWNYVTIEFDQNLRAGKYTFLKVYLNGNVIYSGETQNAADASGSTPGAAEQSVMLVLGECKNSFLKDLRVSNYLLEKTQILQFMTDKGNKGSIDSKKASLFDFEREINEIKKDLFSKKNREKMQEKCYAISDNWTSFKSQNQARLSVAK
jgi:hypothetical protein